jgi:hypothetical protein
MEEINANVVAITFCKPSFSLWNELKVDGELILEREPSNPRDPNAIKVIFKGFHLGYVQKEVALILSKRMDEGIKPKAVITRIFGTPTDRPHIELIIISERENPRPLGVG